MRNLVLHPNSFPRLMRFLLLRLRLMRFLLLRLRLMRLLRPSLRLRLMRPPRPSLRLMRPPRPSLRPRLMRLLRPSLRPRLMRPPRPSLPRKFSLKSPSRRRRRNVKSTGWPVVRTARQPKRRAAMRSIVPPNTSVARMTAASVSFVARFGVLNHKKGRASGRGLF